MKAFEGKYLMVMIAACGMMGASVGMITNVSGLFFSPVTDELDVGIGSVSMTLTISNVAFAIGGMAVPRFIKFKKFKLTLLIGTLCMAGATAGLAATDTLVVMYLLNALRGLAAGVLGMVPSTILINNWFRTHIGLFTSIAMGCSGLAGAVFSPVISAVIQSAGWRIGYLAAAGIIILLELPALLLPIAFRPEELNLEPLGEDVAEETSAHSPEITVSLSLFMIAMVFAVISSFNTALPQHFPGLAGTYGFAAAVGSGMLSVCMVMNTTGKILFGVLADRFGAKKSILLYGSLVCIALGVLMFARAAGALIAAAGLFGLSYSLSTVGAVLLTKDTFGIENYSKVYPKITLGTMAAVAVGSSLIGFFYDVSGSYNGTLVLILVLQLAVMALAVTVYRRIRKRAK